MCTVLAAEASESQSTEDTVNDSEPVTKVIKILSSMFLTFWKCYSNSPIIARVPTVIEKHGKNLVMENGQKK